MDWITDGLVNVLEAVLSLLPDSPFKFLQTWNEPWIQQYLKWLNWFIPMAEIMTILTAWLTAILIYYVWQVVLRWLKGIQ